MANIICKLGGGGAYPVQCRTGGGMAVSTIKCLPNGWEMEILASPSYGNLIGYINKELKLATLIWNGNSISPGRVEKKFNVTPEFIPVCQLTVPMRNGDRMTISTDGTAQIVFTDQLWSNAAVMYPIA